MSRSFWVWLHRWVGLVVTIFLVIVGLTGSVLAFREELDLWLNPELLAVREHAGEHPLDPLALRAKVAALYADTPIDSVPLSVKPGRSVEFAFSPGDAGAVAGPIQVYLDPYTGEKLGERAWGRVSLAKQDIISFLYHLHYSLALPASTGSFGGYALGVVALLWTIDCFVSFYLTFPLRRRENGRGKSWLARWKLAWLVKLNGGGYRINFDIHRAFGLWTWAMLFIFAWSSVGFNLNEVYKPTMRMVFGLSQDYADLPMRPHPVEAPQLDWRAARERGQVLLNDLAREHGFKVLREELLALDRARGVYYMAARSSVEPGKHAATIVAFDADSGQERLATWPGKSSERTGDVISRWLFMLHMAAVFGVPMQIFVCAMGLVIVALSITGVVIWLKKRRARRLHAIGAILPTAAAQELR